MKMNKINTWLTVNFSDDKAMSPEDSAEFQKAVKNRYDDLITLYQNPDLLTQAKVRDQAKREVNQVGRARQFIKNIPTTSLTDNAKQQLNAYTNAYADIANFLIALHTPAYSFEKLNDTDKQHLLNDVIYSDEFTINNPFGFKTDFFGFMMSFLLSMITLGAYVNLINYKFKTLQSPTLPSFGDFTDQQWSSAIAQWIAPNLKDGTRFPIETLTVFCWKYGRKKLSSTGDQNVQKMFETVCAHYSNWIFSNKTRNEQKEESMAIADKAFNVISNLVGWTSEMISQVSKEGFGNTMSNAFDKAYQTAFAKFYGRYYDEAKSSWAELFENLMLKYSFETSFTSSGGRFVTDDWLVGLYRRVKKSALTGMGSKGRSAHLQIVINNLVDKFVENLGLWVNERLSSFQDEMEKFLDNKLQELKLSAFTMSRMPSDEAKKPFAKRILERLQDFAGFITTANATDRAKYIKTIEPTINNIVETIRNSLSQDDVVLMDSLKDVILTGGQQ